MKRSILFFIILGVSSLLALPSLFGQTFKAYYENRAFEEPIRHTLRDMVKVPGTRDVAFAGEFKAGLPGLEGFGYVLRTDPDGRELGQYTISTNFQNTTNGTAINGLAMDKLGNYYLAGNYSPDLNGNFVTQERTLTQLSPEGKFNWSSMQGYYTFVSSVVDEDLNQVLTLSGPNSSLIPTNLTIQQFDKNGNFLLGTTLETLADDRPVKLIDLPGAAGYLAIGVYDTAGIHRPLVARLNTNLELMWSQIYELNAHFIEVSGASHAGEAQFGITGYIENTPGARKEAFILVGDLEDGAPEFLRSYQHSEGFSTYANTLVGIPPQKPGQEPVWVIGGAFDNAANDQRSFACKLNQEGQVEWAWNFSDLEPSDYTHDEQITAGTYIPVADQIVLGGEFVRSLQGHAVRRMVWVLRANLESGNINGDGYGCAAEIKLLDQEHNLVGLPIGSLSYGGAIHPFGYTEGTADASVIYCALPHDDKGKVMSIPQEIVVPGSQHIRQAEMLNLNGQVVASWTIPAGQARVNWQRQGLSAGLYLLRIHGPDQAMSSRKVMVHP